MPKPPATGHALGASPRNPEAKAPASLENRPGRKEHSAVILSFARTSEAFLAGVKTVSRRDWSERYAMQWVKAWEEGRTRHQAWNKVPRCKGAHQIGYFDLKACVYQERLVDMPEEDVQAEGGLWLSKEDYIVENGWQENKVLWVVRFRKASLETELTDSQVVRSSEQITIEFSL